ncbi:site-specific DNA-methyltransferase [Acetivibrio clariflavus]|jgi:adenine-specific DNA-methyltransferase|uniref:Adenine specific DNA methylase Mod n=1 Tax=Acetivibrio clariflavus (strain DSM 19732 / NBRC 101661 / EBR45) TaxID=720554 RepID=G8LUY5_ACECE|nr:site-specific DNA-methyltransferase [Acetivibrio clariflavus]AEV68515.1 adenine specific DNA methylase Mod [Acetivibrio clariflavus DSM 19732]
MIETTLTGKTPDIGEENIKKLMTMFPEVVTEGKVDFEKLKQLLGEYVDDSNERYNFTWNGKGRALRLSQTPSLGTLRPCKEESKDWDTTQNLYIEGDNLEVLKLLQKSYHSKVKMIYIDPPYNTGKDFVYPDDFHDSLENYKKLTGQVDSEGNRISTNTEASGRYHTDWLNMMYPRLRLARNLLTEDGVIFISIDDNEVHNLRKICDEVFGEDNFVSAFIRKGSGGRQDSKHYAIVHEYILCYAKQISLYISGKELKEDENYPFYDEVKKLKYKTQLLRKWGENSKRTDRPNLFYPIPDPDGNDHFPMLPSGEEGCWRWGKEKMFEEIKNGRVEFKRKDGAWIAYEKIFEPTSDNPNTKLFTTIVDDIGSSSGAGLLKQIFNEKIFDYPKPVDLIKRVINFVNIKDDDIILDFFSGSATTAHAIMQLNAEDGGNRKFIMVQLPEPTDEKSEAYKAGYKNICEIGKERIRRAGEKIKEEYKDKENIENLDIGFKVFKLDTSNIRKWQPDYDNLEQSLMDYVDNFVEGRTEFDVVYEIMLKYGLDLTYPVDEFTIAGKKVYSIGYGMLMICLDNEITTEVAKGILTKIKELSPESSRVVFKDNGFKSDSNKTNIKEILKSGGIEEFITI